MALSVEAAETAELYQWRDVGPAAAVRENEALRDRAREELADVALYALSLATRLDVDLGAATAERIESNRQLDPVGGADEG